VMRNWENAFPSMKLALLMIPSARKRRAFGPPSPHRNATRFTRSSQY
jgi:hypothetical protein